MRETINEDEETKMRDVRKLLAGSDGVVVWAATYAHLSNSLGRSRWRLILEAYLIAGDVVGRE